MTEQKTADTAVSDETSKSSRRVGDARRFHPPA